MRTKVWTRAAILAASGIKELEWPVGWHLHGPPDYKVSPEAPTNRGGRRELS